jgi:integrase
VCHRSTGRMIRSAISSPAAVRSYFPPRTSPCSALMTSTSKIEGAWKTASVSPLGRRPYELRHAAVSLWLNSGVPATEVARRAGHEVAVLLKIYAHCIDGQADAANRRITDALSAKPEDAGDADEWAS